MNEISLSRLGPSSFRIQFAHQADEAALSRCRGLLRALEDWPGLKDMTPGYTEILLEFDSAAPDQADHLAGILKEARPLAFEAARLHEIPVIYDGSDLGDLARLKNISPSEVVALHSAPTYSVHLIGFSPGFPYLGPLDERLHTPRLASPRPRIEPGSVAIGGSHTGIYSIASPGGWHIIGRTPVPIFSPAKAQGRGDPSAFLLRQGDRVRFIPQA